MKIIMKMEREEHLMDLNKNNNLYNYFNELLK